MRGFHIGFDSFLSLFAPQILERADPVSLSALSLPHPTHTHAHSHTHSPFELCRWSAAHLKLLRLRWHLRLDAVCAAERPERHFSAATATEAAADRRRSPPPQSASAISHQLEQFQF